MQCAQVALLVLPLLWLGATSQPGLIPGQGVSFLNLASARGNISWTRSVVSQPLMQGLTLEGSPLLDEVLVQRSLQKFNRERVPERVVHAKGSTFYGTFRVTNADIVRYTRASVFSGMNKWTRVAARFSTSLGERGSADTAFGEVRGLGIKFYTDQGNLDLLCINMPIFFINDPQLFPQLTHAQKRHPRTDFRNADNLWDFFSLRPETLNLVTLLYSNFGLPDGYRHMPAFSVNAFRLTNSEDRHFYAKFIWLPQLGIRNLNLSQAILLAGQDPDYARRDLFNSIENKRFPSWTLYIQVITLEEVHSDFTYNPFDATKLWPFDKYPLIEVGTMRLTHNVHNAFAENEQIALNPANLVPGIEPSPDRLLRGRLFSYRDTQFYRLGANHATIPVNREPNPILSERDGFLRTDGNLGDMPNYFPNSHFPELAHRYGIATNPFAFSVDDIMVLLPDSIEQQYQHARESYSSLSGQMQSSLHQNMAFALSEISRISVLNRVLHHLHNISPIYAEGVKVELLRLQSR